MASANDNGSKSKSVLSDLIANRSANIQKASSWPLWELEDQLKRAQTAKLDFLETNPAHDLSIIDEHISQLEESLKLRFKSAQA